MTSTSAPTISSPTSGTPPLLVETVEVVAVERLSPSFVRVELAAAALADLADGPTYDQRIKLVVPDRGGPLPSLDATGDSWYADWLALPEAERGHLRTYTLRAVRGSGEHTRLVVDLVLHEPASGPGGEWAARAVVGDRLVVVAPRRGFDVGGIEFEPGSATSVLLVGDETAVPAVAAIIEQLPEEVDVAAFLEVPQVADILRLHRRPGVSVSWFPRDGAPRGEAVHAAVLRHLGARPELPEIADEDVDPDLWEVPSGSGADDPTSPHPYAWIAGEAKVVTALRRSLVSDLGFERRRVAFMGYWRDGVAMRS